ncbi:acetoacetyl-coenzyme A synthetase [Xylariomycetidae sp. FL0641]|nr:acetoacetyl-coenzyme A synthetase [Xylariomycetidae sp. FL0641]
MAATPRKLWEHPNPKSTQMWEFLERINKKHSMNLQTYHELHQYSLDHRSDFYAELFDHQNFIYTGSYTKVVDESKPIDSLPRWFEGVRLSWVENLLWARTSQDKTDHLGKKGKEDSKIALTEVREGASEIREMTWATLRKLSAQYAAALHASGVRRGDRIVVVGANSFETLLIFNATGWLGAMFSSSSTDMGVQGILQRTVQINPKYIFMDDAALYNGKRVDLRQKMAEVVAGMKDCSNFRGMVSIPRFREALDIGGVPRTQTLPSILSKRSASPPPMARLAFHDPFLVCYSSGTTGIPKAIVHSVGGVLLNSMKEGRLHDNGSSADVSMQYTTTGWIMYLAGLAWLLTGAHVVLYDGSPFVPGPEVLIDLLGKLKVTRFGISPRWMTEIAKAGLVPRERTDLSRLRNVTSTGMVLSDQLFEWFYDQGFPAHVHLNNVSGGTDIAGCFAQGNPLTPVYVGGTQGPSLGIPVALFDTQQEPGLPGREVAAGEPGELVATASFPNVPVYLWGDTAPAPGAKYRAAYFARYAHAWAHGDFCVRHPALGTITFLGRADGVLNPSGVRFGSAEVYAVLERHFGDAVGDAVCVGQRRPGRDEDERVMLFLLMRPGHRFDAALVTRVKEAIARDLTKRHVPKFVFETPEIPTTVNLKKVELPVKQIVSGQIVKPSGTLLNPQSLDYYYQFAKVEELVEGNAKL